MPTDPTQPPRPDTPSLAPAERLAREVTQFVGGTPALFLAGLVVGLWLVAVVQFGPSSGWYQLFEQAITSVTFMMVFVIQRSQNKDTLAIHLKLDELLASNPRASNLLLNAEDSSEDELERLRRHFQALDVLARRAGRRRGTLLVDEMRAGDDDNADAER